MRELKHSLKFAIIHMEYIEFKNNCNLALTNKFKCPRRRQPSDRCKKEIYIKSCFDKYTRTKSNKTIRDKTKSETERSKYEQLANEVWKRDASIDIDTTKEGWNINSDWYLYCRFYKCLNDFEKEIYADEITKVPISHLENLVMAHRQSKGSTKKLKYEASNVFLISQFPHDRIDKGLDPLVGKVINKERRDYWWKRIANESD